MSLVKTIDLENGSATGIDGFDSVVGSFAIASTTPMRGGYYATCTATTSYGAATFTTALDSIFLSFYVRFRATAGTTGRIVQLVDGSGNLLESIKYNSAGNLGLYNASDSNISGSSFAVSTNTVYRIGLRYTKGTGANGILQYYVAVGDAPFGTAAGSTTADPGTAAIKEIRFGSIGAVYIQADYDSIRIDDAVMPAATGIPKAFAAAVSSQASYDKPLTAAAALQGTSVLSWSAAAAVVFQAQAPWSAASSLILTRDTTLASSASTLATRDTVFAASLAISGTAQSLFSARASVVLAAPKAYTASVSALATRDTLFAASLSVGGAVQAAFSGQAGVVATLPRAYTASASTVLTRDTTLASSASTSTLATRDTTLAAQAGVVATLPKLYVASASTVLTRDTTLASSASALATRDTLFAASLSVGGAVQAAFSGQAGVVATLPRAYTVAVSIANVASTSYSASVASSTVSGGVYTTRAALASAVDISVLTRIGIRGTPTTTWVMQAGIGRPSVFVQRGVFTSRHESGSVYTTQVATRATRDSTVQAQLAARGTISLSVAMRVASYTPVLVSLAWSTSVGVGAQTLPDLSFPRQNLTVLATTYSLWLTDALGERQAFIDSFEVNGVHPLGQ